MGIGQVMALVRRPAAVRIVARVRRRRLTYLEPSALLDLWDRAHALRDGTVPGIVIEAGCALGGSAIVIASGKPEQTPLYVYDVFSTIPPPSERDDADVHERYEAITAGKAAGLGGDRYYGYEIDLMTKVRDAFRSLGLPIASNNVHLVKGLFEDTIHPDGPVALAHIDGDWYDSVTVCLERIWPKLCRDGVIVVDDYEAWSGCRKAVDDFFEGRDDYHYERRARLHIVKR